MLNRPTNDLIAPPTPDGSHWDRRPGTRLTMLGTLVGLSLLLIGGRVAWIQQGGLDLFVRRAAPVTVTTEPIPTHDGRILAADGTVLAHDLQRFRVRLHYRWLEFPADPTWLREQALARLVGFGRRDKARLAAAKSKVLAHRETMHAELARVCRVDPQELRRRMQAMQDRVERVVTSVQRRRATTAKPAFVPSEPGPWWQVAWENVRTTLTTPPRRLRSEPVVVTEELEYHRIFDNVPLEAAAVIQEHPERFPGVEIRVETRRSYPAGALAAHVVGTRRRQPRSQGLVPDSDWIGTSGVEQTYDHLLRGRPGLKRIVTNRSGEVLSTRVLQTPRRGRDIELTLSLTLQKRAEQLLDAATNTGSPGGAIAVIDLHTGAVLAAASAPRFDPNLLISPDPTTWQRLSEDPRRPFFCRVTRMALPPGSVFKSLSATALLESGVLEPGHSISCRGYLDHPGRHRCYVFRHFGVGHGETAIGDALCRSCNVFFFDAARRLARSDGHRHLHAWAARFGFGQPTGIDLPGESAGRLPAPPDKPRISETMQLAIGQGPITATPLQIARLMAAIANNGTLVTPHVVANNGPARRIPRGKRIQGLSRQTLVAVREGLRRVVADPRGTGYKRIRLPEVSIAGKTGTAEVGGDMEDHAWFAGYVPTKAPRLAFVVVLEHAGSGGRTAGPVARQLVQAIRSTGLIGETAAVSVNRRHDR